MSFQIHYINVNGQGFNDKITVDDGTTVAQLLRDRMPGSDMSRYNIRVNNIQPTADQVLRPNDSVAVTPGKFDGGGVIDGLKAAAELGAMLAKNPGLREDIARAAEVGALVKGSPDLAENIRHLNSLGSAIAELPDAAKNTAAALEFFAALRAESPAAAEAVAQRAEAPAAAPAPRAAATPGKIYLGDGLGLAQEIDFTPGETITQLFTRTQPGVAVSQRFVHVNGATVLPEYELVAGDTVTISKNRV